MNIEKPDEDTFARNARGISKIYHEVLLLMKFLQTKLDVKNINNYYFDLYKTVIKNRDEKEILDNQCENDYKNFKKIVRNNNISNKRRETTLG